MKIAMVFDGLQVGGIERVGSDYAKLFLELGHTIDIINLNPSFTEMEDEFPDECKILHFNFSRKLAPEQYAQLVKKSWIYKLAYPIVGGLLHGVNFIYKLFYRIQFKDSYDLIIAFSGHFNDLTFVQKSYAKNSRKLCWLHGALYSYILISDGYLNLYKKIKNLVVLVDNLQDEVFAYNRNLDLKITKLYNPSFISDREINASIVEGLREEYGDFIIMVGRLSPDKDQMTVISAMKYLKEKYGFQRNLIFVGDGPERRRLEKAVMDAGLENAVFFEGSRSDVQNYYTAASLFVHSSPLEGLPTTLIEALYYHLPIVASDSISGVREILGNNEYGLIIPVGDYEKMGDVIYEMYRNPALYASYQNKSSDRFRDFSPESIREKLQETLRGIFKE